MYLPKPFESFFILIPVSRIISRSFEINDALVRDTRFDRSDTFFCLDSFLSAEILMANHKLSVTIVPFWQLFCNLKNRTVNENELS